MKKMGNPIKNLLAETETARENAKKHWMTTDGVEAARWIGEMCAFDFVIDRLKSILEAIEDK